MTTPKQCCVYQRLEEHDGFIVCVACGQIDTRVISAQERHNTHINQRNFYDNHYTKTFHYGEPRPKHNLRYKTPKFNADEIALNKTLNLPRWYYERTAPQSVTILKKYELFDKLRIFIGRFFPYNEFEAHPQHHAFLEALWRLYDHASERYPDSLVPFYLVHLLCVIVLRRCKYRRGIHLFRQIYNGTKHHAVKQLSEAYIIYIKDVSFLKHLFPIYVPDHLLGLYRLMKAAFDRFSEKHTAVSLYYFIYTGIRYLCTPADAEEFRHKNFLPYKLDYKSHCYYKDIWDEIRPQWERLQAQKEEA